MRKEQILYNAICGLEQQSPEYSVRAWLNNKKRVYLTSFPLILLACLIFSPYQAFLWLFVILNIIYLLAQVSKFIIIVAGIKQKEHYNNEIHEVNLPIYTILLPLYKEDKVINKLIKSLSSLDYPQHLLDIKLLIEEDDLQTLSSIRSADLPFFFEIILVPQSNPRTKPKACNYGLHFAKGKYITIYDAEDKPSPNQLKQVVQQFSISEPNVVCIQAKLNYYNKKENLLTKLFAIEYSLLFDFILLGLKKFKMPIPLGGSSNHFITIKLKELGGWDAFNVTEDADLGIRLYHKGYCTDVINNLTLEEAPLTIKAWLTQRSRWIKGHILTSLLHLTQSQKLKMREALGIICILYLPNLTYLLLPVLIILCCIFYTLNNNFVMLWKINLLLSIILPMAQSIFIIITKRWYDMKSTIILLALYYWLLPIAGLKALRQIFNKPYHWDKTEHGITKYEQ